MPTDVVAPAALAPDAVPADAGAMDLLDAAFAELTELDAAALPDAAARPRQRPQKRIDAGTDDIDFVPVQ